MPLNLGLQIKIYSILLGRSAYVEKMLTKHQKIEITVYKCILNKILICLYPFKRWFRTFLTTCTQSAGYWDIRVLWAVCYLELTSNHCYLNFLLSTINAINQHISYHKELWIGESMMNYYGVMFIPKDHLVNGC